MHVEKRVLLFWKVRPHLELLGHDGHVHVPTFGPISHVSGPKLTFGGNFTMVLHGFVWRSPKNTFCPTSEKIRILSPGVA